MTRMYIWGYMVYRFLAFSFAIQKKHTPLADLVQKALDMEKESQKELCNYCRN